METKRFSKKWTYVAVRTALCLGLLLSIVPVRAGPPDPSDVGEPARAKGMANVIVLLKSQPLEEAAQEVKEDYRPQLEDLQAQMQAAAPTPWEGQSYATVEEEREAVRAAPPLTAAQQDQRADLSAQMEGLLTEMRQEMVTRARPAVAASQEDLIRFIESVGGTVTGRMIILNAVAATIPVNRLRILQAHPDVAEVFENNVMTSHLDISADTIDADTWWNAGYTGGAYDIGIVDSGVDKNHPALSGHTFYERKCLDAAGNPWWDPTVDDVNGHGTHVAGISSSTDASYTGVAYGGDAIVNAKAGFDLDGVDGGFASMWWSDAMVCVDWALYGATDDADALNLSYGSIATDDDNPYLRFWDAVVNTGLSQAAISAGNDGPGNTIHSPSIAYNVLSVAAVEDQNTLSRADDVIWNSSSRGPTPGGRKKPDIAAPGVGIMSADNSWETTPDFIAYNGTSMAAPHVAGAFVLLADYGVYEPMVQKAILLNTAEDKGLAGWDDAYGWGYIDLWHAHFHRDDWFFNSVQDTDPDYQFYKGYINTGDTATLAWNRRAAYAGSTYPTTYYGLSDLDLYLFDETNNNEIDRSWSSIDNVEQVEADAPYGQVVLKVDAWGTFDGQPYEYFALATEEGFSAATGPVFNLGVSPYAGNVGDQFNLDVVVNNAGDLTAHNASVTLSLPAGLTLVAGANPQYVGDLAPASGALASWVVRIDAAGTYDVPVDVYSSSYGEPFTASGLVPVSTLAGIKVAIYDHADVSDVSYWTGGSANSWAAYRTVLVNDPETRFLAVTVSDLSAATLSNYDRLLLPDNAVPDIYLGDVAGWFNPGRRIIAADSATCYAAYSGYMWPASAGSNGHGTYWDYSSSTDDQEVLLAHKITENYSVGDILSSRAGDAQMFSGMLPADALGITAKSTDHTKIYVASRKVPGNGTIVVLGPYHVLPGTDAEELIRDAVQGPNTAPSLAGLPDVIVDHTTSLPVTIDLWAYASDLETPSGALTYTILGPPPAGAGVSIVGNRWLTVNPSASWCGYADVTVRVTDPGGLWDNDTFRVAVTWSCQG